jgi:predicted nucleotidyltransferase
MDVALPLRSLVPSLDAEVLTVLAGTEAPLTGSAVARLATRGSRAGIQKVLDRLERHGVILAQQAGSARLYRLNREHLLAVAILSAVSIRAQLVDRLRGELSTWETSAAHASVFGSTARGDGDPDSDIDLLVVRRHDIAPDHPVWQRQLRELETAVRLWTGNQLSIFETTQEDLVRLEHREPVIDSWRRDAVTLVGLPIRDLVGSAAA